MNKSSKHNFWPIFHYLHQMLIDFRFYISQGSVATQFRCGGMFINQFTTNVSQNVPVEKVSQIGQYLAKKWTKYTYLLFWATL